MKSDRCDVLSTKATESNGQVQSFWQKQFNKNIFGAHFTYALVSLQVQCCLHYQLVTNIMAIIYLLIFPLGCFYSSVSFYLFRLLSVLQHWFHSSTAKVFVPFFYSLGFPWVKRYLTLDSQWSINWENTMRDCLPGAMRVIVLHFGKQSYDAVRHMVYEYELWRWLHEHPRKMIRAKKNDEPGWFNQTWKQLLTNTWVGRGLRSLKATMDEDYLVHDTTPETLTVKGCVNVDWSLTIDDWTNTCEARYGEDDINTCLVSFS